MQNFLPFLQWLSDYKKADFSRDLLAGLTAGVILIPQAMAYAMIAGLPPVYGLYAAIFPVLVYAFLGTSKNLGIGPVAMDSLLVAAGLGTLVISTVENYIVLAILLAFLVGAMQFILGLFRMGFLVNFLSKPVISGFTSAAALIIIFSQMKHLFGVDIARSNIFHEMVLNAIAKISEINMYDFGIGILGILSIVLLKKWNKKIPAILVVVVLGIVAVRVFGLERFGVNIVGEIPSGLPSFGIPEFRVDYLVDLLPIAFTLALVGYLEIISIGKSLEEKEEKATIDPNQELIAIGSANMIGSLFRSYPVSASFSRSAILSETGVRTNMAGFFSVLLVLLTLLFFTPVFYYLPNSVLASVIMVSVFGLIDMGYPKKLWQNNKDELVVLLLTFFITLFIGIPQGILTGVLFSLLLMVYRTSNPHFAILGNIKNSDYYRNVNRFNNDTLERSDLLIVRFDAQLYFGNSSYFKKRLYREIQRKGTELRGIILNAEAINYIDSSAAVMLAKVIREVQGKGLEFYIAGAIGPTRDIIFNSEIITELRREHLFIKTSEAVAYFDNPSSVSVVGSKVAYQNRNGL
ncbi:MAG: sulfate permease [Maribacter sp.]